MKKRKLDSPREVAGHLLYSNSIFNSGSEYRDVQSVNDSEE